MIDLQLILSSSLDNILNLDSQTLQSQDIIIHAASPNHHQCNDDKIREKYIVNKKND